MTETEEPQFTSLSARIAALNQQGVGKSLNTQSGKRPPPPLPPTNRPALPSRNTVNNPPISTYGSSVTSQPNNLPLGKNGQPLLPPPPVDRDQPETSRTPPLPARNAPPPLPTRKASQPDLPPRNISQLAPSTQMVRRGSNSSTISYASTMSGMSWSQGSSTTSASSIDTNTGRKMAPALGEAVLPPLPPTRREREEMAKAAKVPLITAKSAPVVPLRDPPVVEQDLPPKMPPRMPARPTQPKVPARPKAEEPEIISPQPRRLPPSSNPRPILSMGFNHKPKDKPKETPNPEPRAVSTYSRPAASDHGVVELTPRNFDSTTSGKFALIDFYAPYCKYCVELDPIYKKLADAFSFASDRLVIAKMDVSKYSDYKSRYEIEMYPTIMFFDNTSAATEVYAWQRELKAMTEFLEKKTGIAAAEAISKPSAPPKINLASKPTFAQIKAVETRAKAPKISGCLLCRDFSGPDSIAEQYPRQSLPRSHDLTGYLADVLCSPFSSHTDKARAIFTWLHHNIAYDTDAFFGNTVKHVEPRDTINTGLAVCGGYAGLFSAIALKAGLEAVMVTGHGKGYGYTALQPGDAIPKRDPSGHAWNAVRIDGGEWKLLDACWGAGNVGNQVYNKHFTPSYFTMPNDDFGLKHFPQDDRHFYGSDGRIPTWEDYMVGPIGAEPLQLFGSVEDHGLAQTSFTPVVKRISVRSTEVVRFQFHKICEHWDHEKNGKGKPYCMILDIQGVDGRKQDYLAFEVNDFWWWLDVPARDLGAPGQKVTCYAVTTINGVDARGVTGKEYMRKKGRCAMAFGGVAAWDLV